MADQLMSVDSFSRDNLLAGDFPIVTEEITLLMGENRTRGTMLGKITRALADPPYVADGGNTGNGTLSGIAMATDTKIGDYVLECVEAAADGGKFKVIDPDGVRLDDAEVAVSYSNNQIELTVNDGAVDFAVGDKFTITVEEGSGKYKLSVAAAVDGSGIPHRILGEDKDATDEDKVTWAYKTGCFNQNIVTFGAGHTADSVRDDLSAKSMFLKDVMTA